MNKVFGFRGKLVNQTVIVSTLIDLRFGQKENQQFITLKIYFKVFMFVAREWTSGHVCDWQEVFQSPIASTLKYTLKNIKTA